MRINHNLTALNTFRQLSQNEAAQSKTMGQLSSGLRVSSGADDAAGFAISQKMKNQIRGLTQASRNAQDGISLLQTADGALSQTSDILSRMRELAVQSSSGTNTDSDRANLNNEAQQLKEQLDQIGNNTQFNGKNLLDGSLKSAGGATVGQDTTTGSVVGQLKEASVTSTSAMAGGTVGSFTAETVSIDNTNITVNWQNLSVTDQNTIKAGFAAGSTTDAQNAAKDLIVNTINSAIDQSGTNVAHVSGYVDSTGNLVVSSGTQGINSQVKTSGTSGVLGAALGTAGTNGATGTDTYAGTTVNAGDKFNVGFGDRTLQVSITTAITGGATTMASAAAELQNDINNAINSYNQQATGSTTNSSAPGFLQAVTVNATSDGKFEILSQNGPVELSDLLGKNTVKDLGLSQAQTSAAGNGGVTLQIGANAKQTLTFGVNDMRSASLGISGVDISTAAGAQSAINSLDKAIQNVTSERSKIGSLQNRLDYVSQNLDTQSQNLTSASSRITDVDMASAVMENSKNGILAQAAQAMLGQANQQPQGVLQLLRG